MSKKNLKIIIVILATLLIGIIYFFDKYIKEDYNRYNNTVEEQSTDFIPDRSKEEIERIEKENNPSGLYEPWDYKINKRGAKDFKNLENYDGTMSIGESMFKVVDMSNKSFENDLRTYVTIDNNKYLLEKYEYDYELLEPEEDSSNSCRYINQALQTSIKLDKPVTIYSGLLQSGVTINSFLKPNEELSYMDLISFSKEALEEYGGPDNLLDMVEGLESVGRFDKKYSNEWFGYRVSKSHVAWINTADPDFDIAVMKDALGNIYVLEVWDKNYVNIYDVVASFEIFRANGHRFINMPEREKRYIGNIIVNE